MKSVGPIRSIVVAPWCCVVSVANRYVGLREEAARVTRAETEHYVDLAVRGCSMYSFSDAVYPRRPRLLARRNSMTRELQTC
jgi:hypothetical protein